MNWKLCSSVQKCISVGLIGLVTLTGCGAAAATTPQKAVAMNVKPLKAVEAKVGNVHISVDPRIELLTAIQSQVDGYEQLMTRLDFKYQKEVMTYFKPYKKELAVKYHQQMGNEGFAYDAPPTVMIHYGMLPELKNEVALNDELLVRASGQKKVDQFMRAVSDFSSKSNFEKFYKSNEAFYKESVSTVASYLKKNDPSKDLDSFFKMPRAGYHLVLSPMSKGGGYGPSIKNKDGGLEIYGIIGPTEATSGKPEYSEAYIHDLIWHEFSHSYVNPLTDKHSADVKKLEPLYSPIQEMMSGMAYSEWEIALNEHIIRAINIHFISKYQGEEAAQAALESEYNSGFRYIKPLYEAVVKYEKSRDVYPSFDKYYTELLKSLEPFNNDKSLKEISEIGFRGPINNAFRDSAPKIIVTGNPSKDPRYKATEAYAKEIQKAFFKESKVIYFEDLQQLKIADYTLVCYGTAEDLQKAFKQTKLPFEFKEDALYFGGKTFDSAKDIQLATCWTNPENPKNALIIYTAQTPEKIAGINDYYHGSKDYHLFKKGEEIESGTYSKEGNVWQVKQQKTK